MQDVFILGSKGIPAKYGGFETFVEKLVQHNDTQHIQYHIFCLSDKKKVHETEYEGAHCIHLPVPSIGPAKAVLYDLRAMQFCLQYISKNQIHQPIIYLLACRIGPFLPFYKKHIHRLGAQLFVNPDGHEWLRGKWNALIKKYWKLSERMTVKQSDLLVCDSKGIESYMQQEYASYHPLTLYIPYGATLAKPAPLSDYEAWCHTHSLQKNGYYLLVGRFVPENNYYTILREFVASNSRHHLVLITNFEHTRLYRQLTEKTQFISDSRVKFVGTVYDSALLSNIREHAFGYIHGHEVGGTNPSLLESLATTEINLLLDVVFNREVAEEAALYFTKQTGSLSTLIDRVDGFDPSVRAAYGKAARQRIQSHYTWKAVTAKYHQLFCKSL